MADPRLTIAKREYGSLTREKTIVLALLIQLFVAGFSSFLVVGLTSLYDPGAVSGSADVAVTGDASGEVAAAAARQSGVDLVHYPSEAAAAAAFERGAVDAVVVAERVGGRVAVSATIPERSLRKTLVVVQLRETLEALERAERQRRASSLESALVPLPVAVGASPYFSFTYTVLVPLLVFLPVFIAGSVAVDGLTEERERGTLELLRVAPLGLGDVVAGKALAAASLAPLQAALWFALLALNGIRVAHVAALLALTCALAALFGCLAVALALAVDSRQRAQLLYSLSIVGAFAGAAFLPEHLATTVALLAVDSATATTYASVAGYVVAAVVAAAAVRLLVARTDPEAL